MYRADGNPFAALAQKLNCCEYINWLSEFSIKKIIYRLYYTAASIQDANFLKRVYIGKFMLSLFIFILIAYLLGSLSSAIIVSKCAGLPDPRTQGSGNPGASEYP